MEIIDEFEEIPEDFCPKCYHDKIKLNENRACAECGYVE